ncbi:MAG: hypothetical protein JXJ04_11680 [Spirochaetales bacterium]|nr:hypothetical protein [Spirochaetales bacterium]
MKMNIKGVLTFSLIFLLLAACDGSKQLPDPRQIIGKTKREMDVLYGNTATGCHLTAYDEFNTLIENYGYELGNNKLLVFSLKDNRIISYHTTEYRDSFPDSIIGMTLDSLIKEYGEPFHQGYTDNFDTKFVFRAFYKGSKKWSWKEWKIIGNYRFLLIGFIDGKVGWWSGYNFNPGKLP